MCDTCGCGQKTVGTATNVAQQPVVNPVPQQPVQVPTPPVVDNPSPTPTPQPPTQTPPVA